MRSANVQVDFDALVYTSTPPQSLFCPVCKNILIAPLQTSCAHIHTMCTRCLTQALDDKLECPVDRSPMPAGLDECSAASRLISQVIDELEVCCPNDGCDRVLSRGIVEWHIRDECHFELVQCPVAHCEEYVFRKDLVAGQCEHSMLSCEHCGREIMANKMLLHLNECPELSHQCPHCKLEFGAEDMSQHLCPQQSASCEAAVFGCTVLGTRETIMLHVQSCPVKMMMPWLKSQAAKIANLELENRMLKQSMDSFEVAENVDPVVEVSSEYERDRNYLFESLGTLSTGIENLSAALAALDTKQSHMIMSESMRNKDEMSMFRGGLQGLRMQWHHFLQNTRGPLAFSEQTSTQVQRAQDTNLSRASSTRLPTDGSRVKL